MWLSVIVILTFTFIFDLAFSNESNFIFDPDADNWRRKVVCSSPFCRLVDSTFLT
jgi:hypothetical protein